jgi:hypothetical protein
MHRFSGVARKLSHKQSAPFLLRRANKVVHSRRVPNARRFGSELIDLILEGEERESVDSHIKGVVVIDTSPIGTVDFNMGPEEKAFLLAVGKAAALKFLFNRNRDDGPSQEEVVPSSDQRDCGSVRGCAGELEAGGEFGGA